MSIVSQWIQALSVPALTALRDAINTELANRDVCEHGVRMGEYCKPCNVAYLTARQDPENGIVEPNR